MKRSTKAYALFFCGLGLVTLSGCGEKTTPVNATPGAGASQPTAPNQAPQGDLRQGAAPGSMPPGSMPPGSMPPGAPGSPGGPPGGPGGPPGGPGGPPR